jgi:LmbE family N-acetylglucosaminyl deacetylase
MNKINAIKIAVVLGVLCCAMPLRAQEAVPHLKLNDQDRLLVVAPHPDDEAIAAAGLIQEAVRRHIPVRIVYLTNGDSNQLSFLYYRRQLILGPKQSVAMGELRQREAIAAMRSLGLSDDQLVFLGYPDYGTLNVFKKFWKTGRPYRGTLTRATAVPYQKSLTPKAPYTGESMLADFKKVLLDFKPTKIIINHPADDNTDHQAAYLFMRVALWDLQEALPEAGLYAYMVHALGWPRPLGLHPQLRLNPDEHLHFKPQEWMTFELDGQQVERKKEAVLLYRSQIPYKPKYLFTFVRANEVFSLISDISLKPQALNQHVWDGLDEVQQLKNKNHKVDMRHQAVLKSVVYGLEPGKLVVKIKLNQWSRLGFDINLYLLGYKNGVPFADMPKYRLKIVNDHKVVVFDGQKRADGRGITLSRQGNDFFVTVPLTALGNPQKIISSASVRIRNWPEEFSIWTVLRLDDV